MSVRGVETAIRERFSGQLADDNVQAALDAAAYVRFRQSASGPSRASTA